MKCNVKWLLLAVAVFLVMILVLLVGLPRKKETYNDLKPAQKARVDAYIQSKAWAPDPAEWVDTSGKECPVYDSATANLSMRHLPDLPVLLVECHYGVVGRIQEFEYTTAGFCYTLQVTDTFAGYLGIKHSIKVLIDGDGSCGPTAKMSAGQRVLLFLSKEGEYYRPVFYEHGVFSILSTGHVYAFSNLQSNSVYDGQDLSVLLKDIKKMEKEMDIK